VRLDDGDVARPIERKHSIHDVKGAVGEFRNGRTPFRYDMIIRDDEAVRAYEEPAALRDWPACLIGHHDGDDRSAGRLGNCRNASSGRHGLRRDRYRQKNG